MSISGNKTAILCVDDEKSVLLSLKTQLKSYFHDQYRYELSDNASEALDIIDELIKDDINVILIVSDWLMPGMKGDEFLVRVHQKYPHIKTVLLTGHANEEDVEHAKKNANLLACIYKPWKLDDIVNIVNLATTKKTGENESI